MVFKVIDGNLTSIFNKTQNIANGFNIASNSINSYANAFNRLNTQQKFGARWDTFLSGMDKASPKLVTYFQDLAKQGASARASIQDMYAVLLDGNTRGIGNVKSVISAFNQVNPANQQAFAQAVGQTNAQLGIYLSNLNGAKASMSGYVSSLVATTAKTIALKTASMILNGALSAVVSLIIGSAITAVTKLANAHQVAIDKANEAAQAYEDNISQLKNLKDEYLDIVNSTDDLSKKTENLIEWKKKLIEQYGLEKDAIKAVNFEKRNGVLLIYKEMSATAKKTLAELGDTYKEAKKKMESSWYGDIQHGISNSYSFDDETLDKLQDFGMTYKKIYDLGGGGRSIDVTFGDDLETSLKNLSNALYYYRQLKNPTDQQKDLINQLQKQFDLLNDINEEYSDIYTQGNNATAMQLFSEYISKENNDISAVTEESYKNWKKNLIKMAGESKPLQSLLEQMADETFPEYSDSIIDSANDTNSATTSVTSLADTFKALKEALEDIIGYADTYQSAMGKIASGTALTAEEVAKLLEIDPSLFDKFTRTKDGWQIDYSYLRDSLNENVTDAIAKKVGGTKEEFETALEQGNSRLEELQKQRNEILSKPIPESAKQEQLKSVNEQIKNVEDVINNSEQGINLTDFYSKLFNFTDSDVITGAFDDVIDKIDEYNDNITSLNNSINTLNEGNSLSYDEMTGLVNLYPQLQDKVIKTADGYTIEVSALEGVRTQSYQTRNDFIDDQIEMLKTTLETTRERIRLYYAEIGALNNYYEAKKAFEDTEADRQTIASIAELIKILESYKSEVLDPDNSSSSKDTISDKLQNQIDYYKMLLEAIGIVSDKVVEGLEKEKDAIDQKIDALNDEKDALQEKNDEQQRELDLIEAKNNLDKAKKQKVFVYKEGQGLVQVQDEKAVADAQKEYDDIQREIEIANIDKQIDVYDKQKEAIEDQIDAQQKYGEQFTNMESDIQDTLTVEQAKKALGTDEKGLLSLDDKTINGIRDGLATAVYNKDVEDNKENSEYVTVKLEDFLKSVGATVTPTEFKAMASTITNNPANIIPATNANSTINNAQTINNKTANFHAIFNIYDALDPYKIIDTVKEYFNGVLKQTINSVK